jgi:hypothetical protein
MNSYKNNVKKYLNNIRVGKLNNSKFIIFANFYRAFLIKINYNKNMYLV